MTVTLLYAEQDFRVLQYFEPLVGTVRVGDTVRSVNPDQQDEPTGVGQVHHITLDIVDDDVIEADYWILWNTCGEPDRHGPSDFRVIRSTGSIPSV